MTDLETRALAAYYRAANALDGSPMQPEPPITVEHAGLQYIVLRNVNGVLAVYRVRVVKGAPVLKGLKRWPADLAVR